MGFFDQELDYVVDALVELDFSLYGGRRGFQEDRPSRCPITIAAAPPNVAIVPHASFGACRNLLRHVTIQT